MLAASLRRMGGRWSKRVASNGFVAFAQAVTDTHNRGWYCDHTAKLKGVKSLFILLRFQGCVQTHHKKLKLGLRYSLELHRPKLLFLSPGKQYAAL